MITAKLALAHMLGNTCMNIWKTRKLHNANNWDWLIYMCRKRQMLEMGFPLCTHGPLLVLTWMELCPWPLWTRLTHLVVQHQLWQGPVHQLRAELQWSFVVLSVHIIYSKCFDTSTTTASNDNISNRSLNEPHSWYSGVYMFFYWCKTLSDTHLSAVFGIVQTPQGQTVRKLPLYC